MMTNRSVMLAARTLAFVCAPCVALALVIAAQRGVSWALVALALSLILLVTVRIATTVRRLRERKCSTPCACGCGFQGHTLPWGDCPKVCACGCERPCRIHVGHLGDCGS